MSRASTRTESGQTVVQPVKEIYLSLFVLFYRLSRWEGRMKSGSASVSVIVVEGVFALTAWMWVQIAVRNYVQLASWSIVAAAFLIGIPTDFLLVTRGHGIAFEERFRHFSDAKRAALYLSAFAIVLATGVGFYFTAERYHQIFSLPK